jgi:hypothetical protein
MNIAKSIIEKLASRPSRANTEYDMRAMAGKGPKESLTLPPPVKRTPAQDATRYNNLESLYGKGGKPFPPKKTLSNIASMGPIKDPNPVPITFTNGVDKASLPK